MWNTIKSKIEEMIGYSIVNIGIRLIVVLILLFIGFKLINKSMSLFSRKRLKKDIDKTARSFIVSFVGLTLKIVLVITCAAILGVPMTSIVAVIGSAGLAIGLALQGGLSNLAGGIIILLTKPFAVGDQIYIDSSETSKDNDGIVTEIGVMYTKIVTWDNRKIVIPNSRVTSATVTDYTAFPTRRLDMVYSVDYSSDIDKVKSVLLDVAAKHPMILDSPKPLVVLEEHGSSALKFKIRWWLKTEDYWTVYFEINEIVKKAFDANDIRVPFPQLDVHFDGEKNSIGKKINMKEEDK